jgi:hypothetical protein
MKFRPTPPAATWFLKLFCSKPENESVIGDLFEQYQFGRSRVWYWQQVLVIVFMRLYRNVPGVLASQSGFLLERIFPLLLVIVFLTAALVSPFRTIAILGVVPGVLAGILKFLWDKQQAASTNPDAIRVATVDRSKIPITGEIGAGTLNARYAPVYAEPTPPHRGINSASIAGEGFEGLPGLVIAVAFVFIFLSIFLPRHNDWFLVLFVGVEIGAAALYIQAGRRDRKASEASNRALHQINEQDH